MTDFLTEMVATVKCLPAGFLTDELLAPTLDSPFFFSTEATHFNINLAFLARTLMTSLLALMNRAVEQLFTCLLTRIVTPGCDRAWNSLDLLVTVARYRNTDVARRATARMTEYIAFFVRAVLVLAFLTVLTA